MCIFCQYATWRSLQQGAQNQPSKVLKTSARSQLRARMIPETYAFGRQQAKDLIMRGRQWTSMDVNGRQWTSMDVNG